MQNAFYTTCRTCGRQILMIQNQDNGKWMPCNTEIKRFRRSGGPETYINEDGILCRGTRDQNGEWGYRKHWRDCTWNS